ncbi:MAG: hypothetical protein AVDCRST_MAG67-2379 [uncultured Solirubrobacteraceae bacterium]|uniref:Uncharacterized protein n=1 Tax=uncultured Solirubrobacteraceae bacterium TaxID=1162706 RepID=A0A6J4SUA9_9ACTN|nr:MAG: hypothetical protein AVDCRST_MAG67-2379 [uncultured Solirubrobacteraceae bacterium]
MSLSAADEAPRTSEDPAFRDAVTFSFGDPVVDLFGLARVGLGADGASGSAVVYLGEDVVGASMKTADAPAVAESWDAVSAAGVRSTVVMALQSWTVRYQGGEAGFDLRFEAVSAPVVLDADEPVARLGGMEGYEQLCNVTGTVRVGSREVAVRCLGQRGHLWGAPDWSRIELARTLSAWIAPDRAVHLTAVRPAKAKHHDEELVAAFLIDDGAPQAVFDARLSTGYDAELHQRRAGLELWMQEEGGLARRAAGEAFCGTRLDLGELRLDSAFFRWRMEGREGVGRYDLLRRIDGGSGGGLRRRK